MCYNVGIIILLRGIKMEELTQAELKEKLEYNPETGIFTWLINKKIGYLDKDGYLIITIKCKHYRAHRLAWLYMTGSWPVNQIDHIDRNRINNIFENLRDVTNTQNHWNEGYSKNNTSGYKGVYWYKPYKKWKAQISVNGKHIHLGYFDIPEEAAKAYREAKEKYHKIN